MKKPELLKEQANFHKTERHSSSIQKNKLNTAEIPSENNRKHRSRKPLMSIR